MQNMRYLIQVTITILPVVMYDMILLALLLIWSRRPMLLTKGLIIRPIQNHCVAIFNWNFNFGDRGWVFHFICKLVFGSLISMKLDRCGYQPTTYLNPRNFSFHDVWNILFHLSLSYLKYLIFCIIFCPISILCYEFIIRKLCLWIQVYSSHIIMIWIVV
jgi:hypothetical protein